MSGLCTISISTSREIVQHTLDMGDEVASYQNIKDNDTLDTNLRAVVCSLGGPRCHYFPSLGHCLKVPLQTLESQRRLVKSLVGEGRESLVREKESLVREERSMIGSAQHPSLDQS